MSNAEKFILENTNDGSSDIIGWDDNCLPIYKPWLTLDQARKAVEIAREEICEWLQKNVYKYSTVGFYTDAMITDLKQAMKDE